MSRQGIWIRRREKAVVMATHNLNWVRMFPGRIVNCEKGNMQEVDVDFLDQLTEEK